MITRRLPNGFTNSIQNGRYHPTATNPADKNSWPMITSLNGWQACTVKRLRVSKYQQTAEFQQQNYNMTMGEFQYIYWWEWGHRLFGRLIGLVAMGGLAVFLIRRWVGRTLALRLVVLILLGGLQGAIGWWMVASGVTAGEGMTSVASYRLATHLGLAFVILGGTLVLMAFITTLWHFYALQILGRCVAMGVVSLAMRIIIPPMTSEYLIWCLAV